MAFFDDGVANGGIAMSRSRIYSRINELSERIDEENDKKEELLCELARVERAIERFRELIGDLEALIR